MSISAQMDLSFNKKNWYTVSAASLLSLELAYKKAEEFFCKEQHYKYLCKNNNCTTSGYNCNMNLFNMLNVVALCIFFLNMNSKLKPSVAYLPFIWQSTHLLNIHIYRIWISSLAHYLFVIHTSWILYVLLQFYRVSVSLLIYF